MTLLIGSTAGGMLVTQWPAFFLVVVEKLLNTQITQFALNEYSNKLFHISAHI